MKNFLLAILVVGVVINGYWTKKLVKFAKQSADYYKYIDLKTDCLQSRAAMDESDIHLAAQGLTRKNLKGLDREWLPQRKIYDIQDEACAKYAHYMCWSVDPADSANVDHCSDWLLKVGYTKGQIEQVKKTKSFRGIDPK